ncbi:hypothetical protein [Tabrizicola fusiformis]|uniref:hypothetical protein n=1 Tax=Tabrizicola sp. SY72 TaxID=2741673 RepID=UPI001574E5D0|nr:hypothetical protein [Tabrizicola sp. SY72]NTT84983.1 hypothetical protein [Tabrizicola sp. SY72]
MLRMDANRITYRENPLPWPLRAFVLFLGLGVGLGIPAAWLANVGAETSWPVLALVGAVVLVSGGLGGFFLLLALVNTTELWIDPALPGVTRSRRGPLINDIRTMPRHSIGPPALIMREAEDGPFPVLRLPVPGGRPIEMACFDSRAEAERWRDAIAAALRA